MSYKATITSKGQITIPLKVRERLGLGQGDQVVFEFVDSGFMLRPCRAEENPFTHFTGVLGSFETRQEIESWIDDMRDDT